MTTLLLFSLLQWAQATPVVPHLDLGYWNSQDSHRTYSNNCYNYSTNRVTNSFAQPGEASDKEYEELSCDSVREAAASDWGLTPTDFFEFQQKQDETLIALVVAPDYDYHWYRRDDSGKWSHKPGATPATVFDNSDHEIDSPETADRGYYTDFCGYFRIKNFPHSDDEQNGGYVRIGNMEALPNPEDPSEVQILLYSGRRNPRFPVSRIIKEKHLENLFQQATLQISLAESLQHLSKLPQPEPSRLGYQGMEILDTEGLLGRPGARIHFMDGFVTVQDGTSVTQFQSEVFKTLENRLR